MQVTKSIKCSGKMFLNKLSILKMFAFCSVLQSIFISCLPTLLLSSPSSALKTYERDSSTGYGTITTTTTGSVVRATISNPPINLYDYKLINDLNDFLLSLNTSDAPKVVIFDSADPKFFIAHIDLKIFSAKYPLPPTINGTQLALIYVQTVNLIVSLPTIFIGEVSGQAFGAGNELLVHLDIRYAGPGTKLGALEVGLGFTHGNGGIQFLTKLIGPGRASEYLLSSGTVDGKTAAEIGWVNKYYDTKEKLSAGVDALAKRIATFPAGGLSATKAGIGENNPTSQSLANDLVRFNALAATPASQQAVARFIELSINQTRSPFELGLNYDLVDLYA